MPAATKDTGHGAAITLATSALTYKWRKIGAVEQSREKVEDTDLSNTNYKSYLPGDVAEPGEFEVEFCFNPATALPSALAAPETVTITGPTPPGGASGAALTGTGFITKITASPEFTTNGLQIGKMTIAFDGKTGPTHTAAA
jgi:hypothetical protein